ncbi:MAG: hypothetical protein P1U32_06790 [Legionellaceae bacterium]|nr:hypothetical protein [Legionellaceae bacterium]
MLSFTQDSSNKFFFCNAQNIEQLTAALKKAEDVTLKIAILKLFSEVTKLDESQRFMYGGVKEIVALLPQIQNNEALRYAVRILSNLSAVDESSEYLETLGVIDALFEILQRPEATTTVQREASLCLVNLSYDTPRHNALCKPQHLAALVEMLHVTDNEVLRTQLMEVLRNLSRNTKAHAAIAATNGIDKVVSSWRFMDNASLTKAHLAEVLSVPALKIKYIESMLDILHEASDASLKLSVAEELTYIAVMEQASFIQLISPSMMRRFISAFNAVNDLEAREYLLETCMLFAAHQRFHYALIQAGALEAFIPLLGMGDEALEVSAAHILVSLATNSTTHKRMHRWNVMADLMSLLAREHLSVRTKQYVLELMMHLAESYENYVLLQPRDREVFLHIWENAENAVVEKYALEVVRALLKWPENCGTIFSAPGAERWIKQLKAQGIVLEERYDAFKQIESIKAEKNPDDSLRAENMDALLLFLAAADPVIQSFAADALSYVVSDAQNIALLVATDRYIQQLLETLENAQNAWIERSVAFVLSHLSVCETNRTVLLDAGVKDAFIKRQFKTKDLFTLRYVLEGWSNILTSEYQCNKKEVARLFSLLSIEDEPVKTHAANVLLKLSTETCNCQMILDYDGVQRIFLYLKQITDVNIRKDLMCTLLNITAMSRGQRFLYAMGDKKYLSILLKSDDAYMQQSANTLITRMNQPSLTVQTLAPQVASFIEAMATSSEAAMAASNKGDHLQVSMG